MHFLVVFSAAFLSPSNPPRSIARLVRSSQQVDATEERSQDPKFRKRNKQWIVLVDDEESIRQSVGQFLYEEGFQVTACADADAVLEVCRKPTEKYALPVAPDAIVSDVRMPGKNGLELVQILRHDELLKTCPIVLLTAKTLTQDRVEGYQAGADVYLTKPFNPSELLSILDSLIARRAERTNRMTEMRQELSSIKELLKQNGSKVVQKTGVYLTPTEREVLRLLSEGYTNAEIASERGVNVQNVIKMIQKMNNESGTRNRTELVKWGIVTGYLPKR